MTTISPHKNIIWDNKQKYNKRIERIIQINKSLWYSSTSWEQHKIRISYKRFITNQPLEDKIAFWHISDILKWNSLIIRFILYMAKEMNVFFRVQQQKRNCPKNGIIVLIELFLLSAQIYNIFFNISSFNARFYQQRLVIV